MGPRIREDKTGKVDLTLNRCHFIIRPHPTANANRIIA